MTLEQRRAARPRHPLPRTAALLVALGVSLSGCRELTEREEAALQEARKALAARHWEEAESILSEIVHSHPGYGPAHLFRAEARFARNLFDRALEDLERIAGDRSFEPDERYRIHYLRGLSLIHKGQAALSDAAFRRGEAPSEVKRQARELFQAASVSLANALKFQPRSEDAQLSRAYALYRMENYRGALDLLSELKGAENGSRGWRRRFYQVLAWEAQHGLDADSVETCLALAAVTGPERLPLYLYLIDIHDEVPEEVAARIPPLVSAFAARAGVEHEAIQRFLEETARRQEEEARRLALEDVKRRASALAARRLHEEAHQALQEFRGRHGDEPEIGALERQLAESWSEDLEREVEPLIRSGEVAGLKKALEALHQALELTSRPERKVALRMRVDEVDLTLQQLTTSRRIQDVQRLLQSRAYEEALVELGEIDPSRLGSRDRNLYHYLRGVASYHLERWRAAATALREVKERPYHDTDTLEGLALVRAGDERSGIAILSRLPEPLMTDEVRRVLARHESASGRHDEALKVLSQIASPTSSDRELLLHCRTELGLALFRGQEWREAREQLLAAVDLLEKDRTLRAPRVYAHLGTVYYHLGEPEKAKKTFEELVHSVLTPAERLDCRDVFLYLGRLHLRQNRADLAYQDLGDFVELGGTLPADLEEHYRRLVASYADFMPLYRVASWTYKSASGRYSFTLEVRGAEAGRYTIERTEGDRVTREEWSREGIFLAQKIGDFLFTIPVNLDPLADPFPSLTYEHGGREFTSKVVAIDRLVELPEGRRYSGCLWVSVDQTTKAGGPELTYDIFLAPGVGEVERQVYQGKERKPLSHVVLSAVAYRPREAGAAASETPPPPEAEASSEPGLPGPPAPEEPAATR